MSFKIPKLEYWANKYALKYWGRTIEHPIKWNKNIRKTLGRVLYKKEYEMKNKTYKIVEIQMSPSTYKDIELSENDKFHKILKHELCHYFLLLDGINHGETSEIFLNELRRVKGSMPSVLKEITYICECGKTTLTTKRFSQPEWKALRNCDCPTWWRGRRKYDLIK